MGQRIFLALRSTLYVCGFGVFWLWWLPRWLSLRTATDLVSAAPARWIGLVPLLLGTGLVANSIVRFFSAGKGTPAPFDPPRLLVIVGPYRYVRNPMYVGAGLLLAGCTILFVEFSSTLAWCAIVVIVVVNLFVFLYEEPTLREKFGAEYEEYSKHVKRWIPRASPWRAAEERARGAKSP